jgi:hypothetical protein
MTLLARSPCLSVPSLHRDVKNRGVEHDLAACLSGMHTRKTRHFEAVYLIRALRPNTTTFYCVLVVLPTLIVYIDHSHAQLSAISRDRWKRIPRY